VNKTCSLRTPSREFIELESQRESCAALSVSMRNEWSAEDDLQAY
jgi:hypothetical protein